MGLVLRLFTLPIYKTEAASNTGTQLRLNALIICFCYYYLSSPTCSLSVYAMMIPSDSIEARNCKQCDEIIICVGDMPKSTDREKVRGDKLYRGLSIAPRRNDLSRQGQETRSVINTQGTDRWADGRRVVYIHYLGAGQRMLIKMCRSV